MSVFYLNERNLFHISNSKICYFFRITEDFCIQDLYYGKSIASDPMDSPSEYANQNYTEDKLVSSSFGELPTKRDITLFHIYVFPGVKLSFKYVGYSVSGEIIKAEENEQKDGYAENLNILFRCDDTETDVICTISIIADIPVITQRITVIQNGEQTVHLDANREELVFNEDIYSSYPLNLSHKFDLRTGERYESPDIVMLFHPKDEECPAQ